jgi:hypothetical protein
MSKSAPTGLPKKIRKVRKCPHCGSDKGFTVTIYLGGYQTNTISFKGKLVDSERKGADKIDEYGVCLNCDKSISLEILNTPEL